MVYKMLWISECFCGFFGLFFVAEYKLLCKQWCISNVQLSWPTGLIKQKFGTQHLQLFLFVCF